MKKVLLSSLIGNILEWYEFSIFAFFAIDIVHDLFPQQDGVSASLQAFAVFACGYFIRPIGALAFGYAADRFGRKKILPISIILMAIATTAIGCIPSYAEIGITASVLLIIGRMLQCFVVAGEYTSSIVYLVEHMPKNRRGLFGSLSSFGSYLGTFLGSSAATLVKYLNISWRWAFIAGIFLGILGIYMRKHLPETPDFLAIEKEHKISKNPIRELFRHAKKQTFQGLGLAILPGVVFYLLFVYLPAFVGEYGHFSRPEVQNVNTLVLLIVLMIVPLLGFLSDYIGRWFFLTIGPLFFVIATPFLFHFMLQDSRNALMASQILIGVMTSMSDAVIPGTLVSLFPPHQRCTGVAISINISNTFFGGSAPLVATLLVYKTGSTLAPSGYIILLAILALISVVTIYKNRKLHSLV